LLLVCFSEEFIITSASAYFAHKTILRGIKKNPRISRSTSSSSIAKKYNSYNQLLPLIQFPSLFLYFIFHPTSCLTSRFKIYGRYEKRIHGGNKKIGRKRRTFHVLADFVFFFLISKILLWNRNHNLYDRMLWKFIQWLGIFLGVLWMLMGVLLGYFGLSSGS
jgi:uncharacterized protein YneF (UPF0154 family)